MSVGMAMVWRLQLTLEIQLYPKSKRVHDYMSDLIGMVPILETHMLRKLMKPRQVL